MIALLRTLLLALMIAAPAFSAAFDVVVYGGTASGVMAAIAAAKQGRSVALLEPGRHLGGMLTGGLGRTDMDRQQHVIGGYSREFFERAGKHYREPISWLFEPSVAERILNQWVQETSARVFLEHRLAGVDRRGNRLALLYCDNGATFEAKVFIDASYEGDLMKAAGVSYVIGREDREKYGESLAGRQDFLPGGHQLRTAVPPYDEGRRLVPYVKPQSALVRTGEGDGLIQAYCFRLCLTDNPANRLPISKPANYNKSRYGLVTNYLKALGDGARLGDFLGISQLPNNKTDCNSGGAVSLNLPGASHEYPEAGYARRKEIWDEHLSWAQGLLYYLGNEPNVPAKVRQEMQQWGLPKDEFPDTGHWPHQLYVREGRRMLGEYVLTQHDLQRRRSKYDSIGMGGYNIDIREVQWIARTVYRFPDVAEEVLMEGYVSMPVEPYEIPYRSLLPKQQESANLLVTSCISASHVAYSSFRMEPQYMITGHAAGIAAALAASAEGDVHRVPIAELQKRLREQRQILSVAAGTVGAR